MLCTWCIGAIYTTLTCNPSEAFFLLRRDLSTINFNCKKIDRYLFGYPDTRGEGKERHYWTYIIYYKTTNKKHLEKF